jgi:hypothetical protein
MTRRERRRDEAMSDDPRGDATAEAGQAAMNFLAAFLAGDEEAEETAASAFLEARAAMEAAGCPALDDGDDPAPTGGAR